VSEVSEQTQQLVDTEVRRIVDEAHERVVRLLTGERAKLDSLAGSLLEHETLDEDAAYAAAGVAHAKADEPEQTPAERPLDVPEPTGGARV
jgi:cell division protease FtsH